MWVLLVALIKFSAALSEHSIRTLNSKSVLSTQEDNFNPSATMGHSAGLRAGTRVRIEFKGSLSWFPRCLDLLHLSKG